MRKTFTRQNSSFQRHSFLNCTVSNTYTQNVANGNQLNNTICAAVLAKPDPDGPHEPQSGTKPQRGNITTSHFLLTHISFRCVSARDCRIHCGSIIARATTHSHPNVHRHFLFFPSSSCQCPSHCSSSASRITPVTTPLYH